MNEIRYQANPDVSCGDEPDGAVLFNPDNNTTIVINPSGRFLWGFLEQARTVDEIVKHLLESYSDVKVEQASADAKAFVESLSPDFVLEVADGS
jgi:hypothetical protein